MGETDYRVLVIADTHGSLPDWVCSRHFDALLHAGDIGSEQVLTALHCFDTLHAVQGNVDHLLSSLPETVQTTLEGVRVFLVHNLTAPHRIMPHNASIIAAGRPQIVVFGHTHQPLIAEKEGVIYLNPGTLKGESADRPGTYGVISLRDGAVAAITVYDTNHRELIRWPQ